MNDVAPQRLNSASGPLQVHFLCSFLRNDPEVAQYHRVNLKTVGAFFLERAVDKCSMKCVRHIGNSVLLNLWYQPVLEINPAYLIYPKPDLSMSRPQYKKTKYAFRMTDIISHSEIRFLFLSGYFCGLLWVLVSQWFLYSTVTASKKKRKTLEESFDILPANNRNLEVLSYTWSKRICLVKW